MLSPIYRVTIEISCQMDFNQYPFDNHICTFQVGSCKFSVTKMKWNKTFFISDFYDKNSMTCTSQLFDPSIESDFVERNLQHIIAWQNLSIEKQVVRLTSGLAYFHDDYHLRNYRKLRSLRIWSSAATKTWAPCLSSRFS